MSDLSFVLSIVVIVLGVPVIILQVSDLTSGNIPVVNELKVIDCDILKDRLDQSYYHWYLSNAQNEFKNRCMSK